jgi:lipoprotein NlpI
VRAAQDRTKEAIADFDRALERKPQLIYTRFNRGLALLRLGRQAEASRDFAEFRKQGGQFTPAQRELLKQFISR